MTGSPSSPANGTSYRPTAKPTSPLPGNSARVGSQVILNPGILNCLVIPARTSSNPTIGSGGKLDGIGSHEFHPVINTAFGSRPSENGCASISTWGSPSAASKTVLRATNTRFAQAISPRPPIPNVITAVCPVCRKANSQTQPYRRCSSHPQDQNRGCRSTSSYGLPERSTNVGEPLSRRMSAHPHTSEVHTPQQLVARLRTPGHCRCVPDLPGRQSRA